MSLPHAFVAETMKQSARRNMNWYKENLMNVLLSAKEKQARDIDQSIVLAGELLELLDEKLPPPTVVPPHEVEPKEDDSLMKPVEPEVLDILYKGTEKGANEEYLKARNKKSPEDKFFFRIVTSWDYGWQQKETRVPPRDVNYGSVSLIKKTFYRNNNVAPDPPHYAQPTGCQVSICSEYSCNPN